jgi:hypothetical protein
VFLLEYLLTLFSIEFSVFQFKVKTGFYFLVATVVVGGLVLLFWLMGKGAAMRNGGRPVRYEDYLKVGEGDGLLGFT